MENDFFKDFGQKWKVRNGQKFFKRFLSDDNLLFFLFNVHDDTVIFRNGTNKVFCIHHYTHSYQVSQTVT